MGSSDPRSRAEWIRSARLLLVLCTLLAAFLTWSLVQIVRDARLSGETNAVPAEWPSPTWEVLEPAPRDPASGDPASGDPSPRDPSSADPAPRDRLSGDPSPGDPASGDPASGDPAPRDPSSGDPASPKPSSADPAPRNRLSGDPASVPEPDAAERAGSRAWQTVGGEDGANGEGVVGRVGGESGEGGVGGVGDETGDGLVGGEDRVGGDGLVGDVGSVGGESGVGGEGDDGLAGVEDRLGGEPASELAPTLARDAVLGFEMQVPGGWRRAEVAGTAPDGAERDVIFEHPDGDARLAVSAWPAPADAAFSDFASGVAAAGMVSVDGRQPTNALIAGDPALVVGDRERPTAPVRFAALLGHGDRFYRVAWSGAGPAADSSIFLRALISLTWDDTASTSADTAAPDIVDIVPALAPNGGVYYPSASLFGRPRP